MDGVEMVAQLMAISATTEPKSKGENLIKTRVLTGKALKELADAMLAYGQRTKKRTLIEILKMLLNRMRYC